MSSDTPSQAEAQNTGFVQLTPEELAALPHDNRGPGLVIGVWVIVLVAAVFLSLRLYCRAFKQRSLRWDDGFLVASWICIVVESSLLTYMTSLGYGRHTWDLDLPDLNNLVIPALASGSLVVTSAAWSKTSFAITLLHLTHGWTKRLIWCCIISMNTIMALAALFPWVSCTPISKTWVPSTEGTCWDRSTIMYYSMFSSAYSGLMDLTFAFLPWTFLLPMQLERKEKIGILVAMSMGVFASGTAVYKTHKLPKMLSADAADGITIWAWSNAEVCYSIIAASIPMLRVLIRDAKSARLNHSDDSEDGEGPRGNNTGPAADIQRLGHVESDLGLYRLGDDGSPRRILGDMRTEQRLEAESKSGIV